MMLKKYLPPIIIFSVQLFFSISAIVGYQYEGSDSSLIYIIYNGIFFILAILLFAYDLLKNNFKLYKNHLFVLLVPFLVTFIYLFEYFFGIINEDATTQYMYFILWPTSAMLIAIYVSRKNRFKYFIKFLEIIMLIISFAALNIIVTVLTKNVRASIGGASYQYAGYVIAVSFGINLYFINYGHNHERFKFTKGKSYSLLCYFLLIIQLIGVIVTGARGPMVLIIVYSLFILVNTAVKPKQLLKLLSITIGLLIIMGLFWSDLMQTPIFEKSLNRAFAYITKDGINWEGTSGRDKVYLEALQGIIQSPLFGYGLFGMWKVFGNYPHNLFLEVLLQGGIIYLFIFLTLTVITHKRLIRLVRINNELMIILVLFLYPLVLLMFSGTYLSNTMFWFCVSFICCYPLGKNIN